MPKKMLPIDDKPMVRGYLHHAYQFCVLGTDLKKTAPFICNNYIQVTYRTDNDAAFDYFGAWELLTDVFTWKQFDKEVFANFETDFCGFMRDRIDNGYYLWLWVDEYYIPNRFPYHKYHYDHTLLVYGYDTDDDIFNVIGFNETNDFKKTVVHGNDLVLTNPKAISYLQINKKSEFKINPELIVSSIYDYLHPETTKSRYYLWHLLPHDYVFGINAVKKLTERLVREKEGTGKKDFRMLFILWENKKLMKFRIKYLLENGFMSDKSILDDYLFIENEAEELKLRYFKYFLSDDKSMLDGIISTNEKILLDEAPILNRVIKDIEKTCKL